MWGRLLVVQLSLDYVSSLPILMLVTQITPHSGTQSHSWALLASSLSSVIGSLPRVRRHLLRSPQEHVTHINGQWWPQLAHMTMI